VIGDNDRQLLVHCSDVHLFLLTVLDLVLVHPQHKAWVLIILDVVEFKASFYFSPGIINMVGADQLIIEGGLMKSF